MPELFPNPQAPTATVTPSEATGAYVSVQPVGGEDLARPSAAGMPDVPGTGF